MALGDVKFVVTAGGLGRLPAEKDHVSSIVMALSSNPAAWDAGAIGKKYLSVDEAEGDLIVEGDANYGILHYQIKEFFRISGAAELYVVNETDANFSAQNFYNLTGGDVRQVYWHGTVNYAGLSAKVTTIKAFVDAMDALFAPLVVVTSVKDETAVVDGTAQTDLRAMNAQEISVLVCGSKAGEAGDLVTSLSVKYIPDGGAVLGALARGNVHENIGWVAKFNLTSGVDLETIVFSDGKDFGTLAASVLDTLNTKGYLFFRNHQGTSGAYVNDTHTAKTATSDFANLENNRTIQKAKRGIRTALLPQLNSPLTVDTDGKLTASTVAYFENLASAPLSRMVAAGELSNFSVTIDPAQDVLATSVLNIVAKLQPRGVARTIQVTIGYDVNIA